MHKVNIPIRYKATLFFFIQVIIRLWFHHFSNALVMERVKFVYRHNQHLSIFANKGLRSTPSRAKEDDILEYIINMSAKNNYDIMVLSLFIISTFVHTQRIACFFEGDDVNILLITSDFHYFIMEQAEKITGILRCMHQE